MARVAPNKLDVTGERYGHLVAIAEEPSDGRHSRWWFACDCGLNASVLLCNVRAGKQVSCGCVGRQRLRESHQATKKTPEQLRETRRRIGREWSRRNLEYRKSQYEKYKSDPVYWEKMLERSRRWAKENKEHKRTLVRNRRARQRQADGEHSRDDIADLLHKQGRRCAICQKKFGMGYHVDHIMPFSRGGSNDKRNLQILCGPCNLTKSGRDPIDNMRRFGWLL